jgi:hypothetical protein
MIGRQRLQHIHYSSIRYRLLGAGGSSVELNRLGDIVQQTLHHAEFLLQRYHVEDNTLQERFRRIDFMRNKISRDNYKYQLEQTNREREKYREFHQVYSTMLQSNRDIFFQIYEHSLADAPLAAQTLSQYMNQFDRLFEYINECLAEIAVTYKCTQYWINPKCEIFSCKRAKKV